MAQHGMPEPVSETFTIDEIDPLLEDEYREFQEYGPMLQPVGG